MKRLSLILFVFGLVVSLFGQNPSPTCYRVYLSDKNNSPYSINNPSAYLSQRAIDKRTRFNIPVTEQDLPVNPQYKQQILALDSQMRPLAVSKWMNTFTVFCPDSAIVPQIENLPFVDSVMAVAAYQFNDSLVSKTVPENQTPMVYSTPIFSEDTLDYGVGFAQIALENGHLLHAEGFHGEGMLIAVIDAGFFGMDSLSFFHELVQSGRYLGKYLMYPDNIVDYYPYEYHGSEVTSMMAANSPGVLIGTAPAASYVFFISEFSNSEQLIEEDFWTNAIEMADSIGADVVNSSLGYNSFPDFPEANFTYAELDGQHSIASRCATIAGEKGMIVCVAVGNTGGYMSRPADAFNILSVGATKLNGWHVSYSSHGPTYDGRVKPDVDAAGKNVYGFIMSGNPLLTEGTSVACPIIAGLSACLWQAMPQFTSSEIMQIIRESSNLYDEPSPTMGYGIPDFHKAYTTNVGINDHKPLTLSIYPNPVTDKLNILNPNGNIQTVTLYNAAGQLVLQTSVPDSPILKINVTDLPNGFYIGTATLRGNKTATFKFVK